jgi:ribonuclease P protein component
MTSALPLSGEPTVPARPARLVRSTDFVRLLQTRSRIRRAHFAVLHLPDWPSVAYKGAKRPDSPKLSTGDAPKRDMPVDDLPIPGAGALWLGTVVPKRHARRSVTRSLLKRQIRAAVGDRMGSLEGGLWVVRLCAPFDRTQFPSAASPALRRVARAELDGLLARAAPRAGA